MKIKTRKKNSVNSYDPNYRGVPPLAPKTKKIVFKKKKDPSIDFKLIELDLPANWEELKGEKKKPIAPEVRKDYCYNCKTDELYWVMMAARCKKCDAIILGGDE